MPGVFSFSSNFDEASIIPQTDFTKGSGPGIDNSTQFSVHGAEFFLQNNDVGIVAVPLYAGQTIHLDVDYGIGGINSIDTKLMVIDAEGSRLAVNNNTGTTDAGSTALADPRMDFTASTTGVYFVAVMQKDNGYIDGSYQFSNHGTDTGDFLLNMSFSHLPTRAYGTLGDDSVTLGSINKLFAGRAGDDTIHAGDVNSRIDGGDGNDSIDAYSGNHNNILTGGSGNDYLNGASGRDLLAGGAGNDFIQQ